MRHITTKNSRKERGAKVVFSKETSPTPTTISFAPLYAMVKKTTVAVVKEFLRRKTENSGVMEARIL